MKQKIRIGVVCLARRTFDFKAAQEIYQNIQIQLDSIENVDWEFISNLVIDIEDAQKVADEFLSKKIDALISISGTFALGDLILELNKALNIPILLWGLDELPYDGGKIRLNSICGINLNASNLYKAGTRNYHVVIGNKVDEEWLDAIRIIKAFSMCRIGIIGSRADGFVNLEIDELDLNRQLGIQIKHFELNDIFNYLAEEDKILETKKKITSLFNISEINDEQLEKVSTLVVKFNNFINSNNLSAVAVRCWPEFANEFGISPCAAMSILQSEGKILSCEGDILGGASMLAHQAIGGNFPFLADFSQVNFQENFALLWHCGVAPCNLWDGKCIRSLDTYLAGNKGVTAGFVMKSGDISIVRIDYSPGDYRIFLQKGKAVPMKKELKGTYMKVNFDVNVKAVLNKIINNGIAHHVSVVYGDFYEPFLIFSKIIGWKIIT